MNATHALVDYTLDYIDLCIFSMKMDYNVAESWSLIWRFNAVSILTRLTNLFRLIFYCPQPENK